MDSTEQMLEATLPGLAKVRRSFDQQPLMAHLGVCMSHLAPGECVLELPYREVLSQHHGYFHGGVVGMLADNAGGFAGYTLMPDEASVLTVEYKINMMAPAVGERMIAEGSVLRVGRNLAVTRAEVFTLHQGGRRHCASMQQTLMTMHPAEDRG
jgi:uncharacterized protein (TIGR00369 family)